MRIAGLVLSAALALATHGQTLPGPPPPAGSDNCLNAAGLLHAAAPLEKAWGACLAVSCRHTELAEDMVTELSAIRIGPSQFIGWADPEASLVQVLLDALIQLDRPVPADVLTRLLPQWRPEVIILLVRNPDSDAALRSLMEHPLTWPERSAVYNTLVTRRAPGVTARLLSEFSVRHEIRVIGPGGGPGFGGGIGDGSAGCGVTELARGFPPTGRYALETNAQDGDILLADGPEPVYYRRVVIMTSGQVGFSRHDGSPSEQVYIAHLAALSGLPAVEVERALHGSTWIQWRDTAHYEEEAARAIAGQHKALRIRITSPIRALIACPRWRSRSRWRSPTRPPLRPEAGALPARSSSPRDTWPGSIRGWGVLFRA